MATSVASLLHNRKHRRERERESERGGRETRDSATQKGLTRVLSSLHVVSSRLPFFQIDSSATATQFRELGRIDTRLVSLHTHAHCRRDAVAG